MPRAVAPLLVLVLAIGACSSGSGGDDDGGGDGNDGGVVRIDGPATVDRDVLDGTDGDGD